MARIDITISRKDMRPFSIGDKVLHGDADTRSDMVAVDIDPPNVCTPYPCVMLAWKEGGKVREGCVETKYLRKAI